MGGGKSVWLQHPGPVPLVVAGASGGVIQFVRFSSNGAAVAGLLVGNHIVDASSLVSLYHPFLVQTLLKSVYKGGVWCKLSAY